MWKIASDEPDMLMRLLSGGMAAWTKHNIDSHWFLFSESPTYSSLLFLSFSSSSFASNLNSATLIKFNPYVDPAHYCILAIYTSYESRLLKNGCEPEDFYIAVPGQRAVSGLPSPLLVQGILPSIPKAGDSGWKELALVFLVQWVCHVIENPLSSEEVAPFERQPDQGLHILSMISYMGWWFPLGLRGFSRCKVAAVLVRLVLLIQHYFLRSISHQWKRWWGEQECGSGLHVLLLVHEESQEEDQNDHRRRGDVSTAPSTTSPLPTFYGSGERFWREGIWSFLTRRPHCNLCCRTSPQKGTRVINT